MPLLYDLGIGLYHVAIRLAARFDPKAKQWIDGRKGSWQRLKDKRSILQGCIWMHCASVGEFEQGRPVLEALKAEIPGVPVLLTFFSPSGYEACKHTPLATHVEYLPMDGAGNAKRLVELLRPKTVLWVKYEFWYHYLHALQRAAVPTFLVSAIFRPRQPFFRWYGTTHRSMLQCFDRLFVQDERSRELLAGIGITNTTVSGDTRFDRVARIVRTSEELPIAKSFRGKGPVLVCGSTWPKDEELLKDAFHLLGKAPKCVVVPHELHEAGLEASEQRFPEPLARWSELEGSPEGNIADVLGPEAEGTLLVDRMGLLARLYRYGDVAYVGGGFGDGIHNLLEAAAWGVPVIFGPNHAKFAEAKGLVACGGGFAVRNAKELHAVLQRLISDPTKRDQAAHSARHFVQERVGTTPRLVRTVLADIEASASARTK